ncbi:unnamed protein product [Cladocopium goreaui]|uniref:132 kDa protein n=1 Tax=Cladocopium goreaui TaxID=2562237 RepID=A0A9P1GIK8_9DINO|nr:unnamed protein product [Cladocopium goreaui]
MPTRCCLGVLTLRLSAGTVGGPVTISSGVRPGQGGLTAGCALVKPSTPTGQERSPARQPQTQRVFCPVPACPCSDPARARGWATVATMKSHIDAHLAGSLQGDVPTARAAAVDAAIPMDTDGLQLPSLSAIQAAKTATIRHVPSAARHAWAQVVTRALAAAAHRNDDKVWRELCMLPKCVLCAPHRGGRQHRKATAAYTLDRLHRWQALAIGLAREGFDRKACAALLSKGLCPPTAATAEAFRALHPQQPPPTAVGMNDLPVAPEIAPEAVARCLRAFPPETATGPSGLRVQHLKDANVAGGSDAFLSQLIAVVNLLAQGRAPEFLAPILAGAGLVALPPWGSAEKAILTVRACVALRLVEARAATIGLRLNLAKSELIAVGRLDIDSFIHSYTVERAAKAGDLLDALGELEDPPSWIAASATLRWLRTHAPQHAALGLGHGGLGLRSTSAYASVAFLASWASALQAGAALDAIFWSNEAKSCPEIAVALACFNSTLEPETYIALDDVLSSKQHATSQRLDHAGWQE